MTRSSVSGLIVLLFLLTFTVGSAFAFDPASGLIVHYEFEDSIADSAGSNDGIDEISGGCVMFNDNGTQRWIVHDGARSIYQVCKER